MNPTIAAMTARALLGRRRALLLLPMPILLIGLTVIGTISGVRAELWAPTVLSELGLAVMLPLTALVVASSVLGLEIEDGTITHILTKPLPRREIVLAKMVVCWTVTTGATAVPLAVSGAMVGSAGDALALFCGAAVGALAYCAAFLALSVSTRRPVAFGLVYIMLWENLLVRFASGAKVLSVQQYAASITGGLSTNAPVPDSLPAPVAAALAAAVIVLATMAATNRLRSFALTGETA